MRFIYIIILSAFIISCTKNSEIPTANNPESKSELSPKLKITPITIKPETYNYSWSNHYDNNQSIINQIELPEGYKRVKLPQKNFGNWLRYLPLKSKGSPVKFYNGATKQKNVHEYVIDLDTGKEDLQQCADAVMRLKAEYHFSNQEYEKIHFNYTSGDKVAFNDWAKGKKPIVRGNSVSFSGANSTKDYSYNNFKKYMKQIFTYAGTASLSRELKKINLSNIQPGDVFIQGGHPGHAVLVLDVIENKDGDKMFMIAQSYMPAQDMHILKNLNQKSISPWYPLNFGNTLITPEWSFNRADLKRFM